MSKSVYFNTHAIQRCTVIQCTLCDSCGVCPCVCVRLCVWVCYGSPKRVSNNISRLETKITSNWKMSNTRFQTIQSCASEAFPFLLAHLKIKRDFSDTDSHFGNLGYRAEQLREEHFQHFINYTPVMT